MEDERARAFGVFGLGGSGEGDEAGEQIAGDALVGRGFGVGEEEGADAVCCYFCRLSSLISTC